MSDLTNSDDRPSLVAAVIELIGAGSELADLVAIQWTEIPAEERRRAVERWQRAVMVVATINTQHSNEATE